MEIIAHYKPASKMKGLWVASFCGGLVVFCTLMQIALGLWYHMLYQAAFGGLSLIGGAFNCFVFWRLLSRVTTRQPAIWIQDDELLYAAMAGIRNQRVRLSDIEDYKVLVARIARPSAPLGINLKLRNGKKAFISFYYVAPNGDIVRLLRRLTASTSQPLVPSGF